MIRVALCDDNFASIKSVAKMIEAEFIEQEIDGEISVITSEQKEIFDAIYKREIDVLFLDVDFKTKGKSGIEFAKDLRNINREFTLIFLTAHQRYMQVSFLVKAFDYLVKPINKPVLEELINRIKEEYMNNKRVFLILNKWISIRLKDILYIEKEGNKCKVITINRVEYTFKTIDTLLTELPDYFAKCHRSFIINLEQITELDRKNNVAYFNGNYCCPINSHFCL